MERNIESQRLLDTLDEMERLQDEITATDQKQIVKSNALTVDRVFNSLTPRQENGVVWEIKALKNQSVVVSHYPGHLTDIAGYYPQGHHDEGEENDDAGEEDEDVGEEDENAGGKHRDAGEEHEGAGEEHEDGVKSMKLRVAKCPASHSKHGGRHPDPLLRVSCSV
ncbi:hypothetical protein LTR56_026288 [Elasticomyces elasticus]|nr:hypothetical protein LTR56_026288 [Elasticomyces elasticus]